MKIYEDEDISILVEGKTVRLSTIKPQSLNELSDEVFQKIGLASTSISALLFETLRAQGTNIVMQDDSHGVITQVIPRTQEDGIKLEWKGKESNEAELKEISAKISDAVSMPPKVDPEPEEKVTETPTQVAEKTTEYNSDSYMVKHLERKP